MNESKQALVVGCSGIAGIATGALIGGVAGGVLVVVGVVGLVLGKVALSQGGITVLADCWRSSRLFAVNVAVAGTGIAAFVVWASARNDGADLAQVAFGAVVFVVILLADLRTRLAPD